MDKNVDTFQQNERFLSASIRYWKKSFLLIVKAPLSHFSLLKYAQWTLSRDCNIEKGGGVEMWESEVGGLTCLKKKVFFRGVSQLLFSMIVVKKN